MKSEINLTALVYVLFFASFNSVVPLRYARFNRALNGSPKSVVASPNTIWVPDNYTTIQEAINNASERETIFVRAGTYYEHVVVNKTVSLIGEDKYNTIIDGRGAGTVVYVRANNITLSGFTIQSASLGIWLYGSTNSIVANNTVSSSIHYGIGLYHSIKNVLTDNDVSKNKYGIHIGDSDNNVLSDNCASNNSYGIYLDYSSDNVLSDNCASNNSYGIGLYHSINNILAGNDVSKNKYGIHALSSNNNMILHNNFVNNTEPPSSIDSVNFFDNGFEGNYWSDYNGTDANWDGIGDTPYPVDENSQDNYPLIGPFSEFDVRIENQPYTFDIVCNSTISNFQCYYDVVNQTRVVSFMVNDTEGKGFCRICVPHALIEPPYTVTIDHNPPLYNNTVRTNGTHTWLYFTYYHSKHEVMIIHMPIPRPEKIAFWSQWWFWMIIAQAVIVFVLLSISIKQKKVIQAYERELRDHLYRGRALFKADVKKRRAKIEEFKKKYNMEIRTADTLEDLLKRWEFKKRVKH